MSRARDVADGALGTIAGTNGQVLTSDGNNWSSQAVPTELPAHGTSGNLLTSNGSAWVSQVAAGGGAWTFLSEVVSTSSTTIDFSNVFDSTYDNYRITANNVTGSTNGTAYKASLQKATNGAYVDYDYRNKMNTNNTSTFGYSGSTHFLHDQNNSGSAAQRANFTVDILNPRSSNAKHAIFNGCGYSGFNAIPVNQIFVVLQAITEIEQSGIRFSCTSGTITGTYRLYGFSKT